jgi:hypothetical protein
MAAEAGRHRMIILRLHKSTGITTPRARTLFSAFRVHLHHFRQDAKTWLLFSMIPSLRSPLGPVDSCRNETVAERLPRPEDAAMRSGHSGSDAGDDAGVRSISPGPDVPDSVGVPGMMARTTDGKALFGPCKPSILMPRHAVVIPFDRASP